VIARTGRAVWAAPGATPGRRGTLSGIEEHELCSMPLRYQSIPASGFSKLDWPAKQVLHQPHHPSWTRGGGGLTGGPLSGTVEKRFGPQPSPGVGFEGTARDAGLFWSCITQHHGTLEILLLLHRERAACKSEMRRRLRPGPEALEGALDSLTELGLISCKGGPSFPFPKNYELTTRGKKMIESPLPAWFTIR
jgi:hypothetical protein